MKVIGYIAAVLSITANGQEFKFTTCSSQHMNEMNKCVEDGTILPDNAGELADSKPIPLYQLQTCTENGDLVYNKFVLGCNGKPTQANQYWYGLKLGTDQDASDCCQKGSDTLEPHWSHFLTCTRNEEVIRITKAVLGENCDGTSSIDLTSADWLVGDCNGDNTCTIQNPMDRDTKYPEAKDLNVCDEAELYYEYVCYYDYASHSRRRRLGGAIPNVWNDGNDDWWGTARSSNGGNSGSWSPLYINANCPGGLIIDIDTCSNGAYDECQGQSSCSYTITPQNSPECGSSVYQKWNCV